MRTSEKTITLPKAELVVNQRVMKIVVFCIAFSLSIVGSWSAGGLFMKELCVAGIIITCLLIFKGTDRSHKIATLETFKK